MQYIYFSESELDTYPVCILSTSLQKTEMYKAYIKDYPINDEDVIAINLHQSKSSKKTPTKEIKQYIEEEIIPTLTDLKTKYIICTDGDYFKALTKSAKVDANLGYVLDCIYGPWKVVYAPTQRVIYIDPEKINTKIKQSIDALVDHVQGKYVAPGNGIIKTAQYLYNDADIEKALKMLIDQNLPLAVDIETFSLKHNTAGIGTITFCWSESEGIAFPVDFQAIPFAVHAPFGNNVRNEHRRNLLRYFFENFKQKTIYHSISFDACVLIYQLYMKDILDTEGLLKGLEIMLRDWDCTKLITYLATNSCSGNDLSLKYNAQEYSGNYALDDIKDITLHPLSNLLEYNLVDGLSTWYVHKKYYDKMIQDDQGSIYFDMFKPGMTDIIQMQLTGMPVNMNRVLEVEKEFDKELQEAILSIQNNKIIKQFTDEYLNVKHAEKRNAKLKTKVIAPEDEPQTFNPNSDTQVRALLFDYLELPVVNLTANKLPSTDGETIEDLINQVTDPEILELLEGFRLNAIISILMSNFIPAMKNAVQGSDGWHYLFGNFNLGGTLSGRLSSSGPNLQNLPSTGKGHKLKLKYAKMIKSCFQAPPGWIFGGIDFDSLEDRISALTTKDPEKLKVYTDGYDGHSLRAYAYFPDKMPDIDPTSVVSINSIQKLYKPLRDRSKNPTFTLTYQGTWIALVKKYGFTPQQAKELEAKYHELYKVSDEWVATKLKSASDNGYITGAFGLRLRTPLLHQVIRGAKAPYESEQEARTAGNALGQSWCLLNTRAGIEFNAKVRKSVHKLDIRPCAQIHDAQYFLIRDDLDALGFTNEHLVKAVSWQDHPEIWHDEVKISGSFFILHPNWSNEIGISNGARGDKIMDEVYEALAKLAEKS